MAIEYAKKYSPLVDERFTKGLQTAGVVNNSYDFIGVETVRVYSIPTVAMNNYKISGTNRYGTPEELENTVQEMQLSQDRSFTFTLDRKSYDDTMMTMEAGKALQRQIEEVVIPEVDKYRLTKLANADGNRETTTISKSNAYEEFLKLTEKLDNALVPAVGRVAFITAKVYNALLLDASFIKSGDSSLQVSYRGFVGEVNGVAIVKVASNIMPSGVNIIITHPVAMVSPIKLESYKIHENAVGIDGWVVEGRIRYDAFILNNKSAAIAVNGSALTKYTLSYDINGGKGDLPADQERESGAVVNVGNGSQLHKIVSGAKKKFVKWNTDDDGTGTDYAAGATLTLSANTTLYAVYES